MTETSNTPQTDPKLDALLDAALNPQSVPGGVPSNLADRIVLHTAGHLRSHRIGVLARIGPTRIRAVAAVIVLAATIGILAAVTSIIHDAGQLRKLSVEWNRTIGTGHQAAHQLDAIDQEMQLLAMQIDQFHAEQWEISASSLEQDLHQFEMELGNSDVF